MLTFAIITGCALFAASVAALIGWWPLDTKPLQKSDVIIVLGAHVHDDGTLTPTLRSRMDAGIALWKAGYAPRIIVTGGAVTNPHVEADAMAAYAIAQGVPDGAIIREPRARSTRQNAAFSAKLMQQYGMQTAIITTSAFHTRRATLLFTRAGVAVQAHAAEYPPEVGLSARAAALLHELGAVSVGK